MNKFHGDIRKYIEGSGVNPVHIEFVAVPSTFDINNYLSIRENIGMFMNHEITLQSVSLISNSIKDGPVFTLTGSSGKYTASALFIIGIFKELGLQINGFSNFIPTDVKNYESLLKNTTFTNSDGTPVINMTIIFINLYKCIEEGILEPVIEAIVRNEEYENEMNSTADIYNS